MRVLFLNRSFWPDTQPTGILLGELSEDLAREHDVTVICGPSSRRANWSGLLFRRRKFGAVKVVRTLGPRFSKRTFAVRIAHLFTYDVQATIAALRECPDIVVTETDPPVLGSTGAIVKAVRKCRFVYYCHDLYPDVAEANGSIQSRVLLWLLRRANECAYRHADMIVALGADMAERLQGKGVPAERIVVIPNWIDSQRVTPDVADPMVRNLGEFVVMYAGNIGLTQNLETVLETARIMRAENRVRFVFVGEGAKKSWLEREALTNHLDNVHFLAPRPPEALGATLAAADLLLIPQTAASTGCLVPSKVYGVLAAGRPFVAMMEDAAEVARLASKFKVGFVSPPADPYSLARVISEALEQPELLLKMGQRARVLAVNEYDRRLIAPRFNQLLKTVAAGAPFGYAGGNEEPVIASKAEPDAMSSGVESAAGHS